MRETEIDRERARDRDRDRERARDRDRDRETARDREREREPERAVFAGWLNQREDRRPQPLIARPTRRETGSGTRYPLPPAVGDLSSPPPSALVFAGSDEEEGGGGGGGSVRQIWVLLGFTRCIVANSYYMILSVETVSALFKYCIQH